MIRRAWLGLCLVFVLVSCSGGSGDLPPPRPASVVSGNAVDAPIQNGHVAVYAFGRDGKGMLLGSGQTDALGFYSIEFTARSQAVLIEVSGGHYQEEASGVTVNLAEGHVLRAVARYESGQPLTAMVTPLTQLAAGLAEYRVAQGAEPNAAVDEGVSALSGLFGLNVSRVLPVSIVDPNNATTQLSDPHRYGFLLAALSSFTQWASAQNASPTHAAYTTMALAQIMYNDIRADGLLDGLGFNKDGDALMNLAFGVVALNQDVYRIAFAQHLLAISAAAQNKTGLTRADLHEGARRLATSAHFLFGGAVPAGSSDFAPAIVPLTPEGNAFNGNYEFKVVIDSVLGAEKVSFDVDGVPVGDAVDAAKPAVFIDTRGYPDGEYTVGVAATDFLGFRSYRRFKYRFDNIFVNITSPRATNQAEYILRGNYGDNGFGLQSLTVQGVPVTLGADKSWSTVLQLQPGRNSLAIVITTRTGIVERSQVTVDLDLGQPRIDIAAGHSSARFSQSGGGFTRGTLANVNNGAPVYIETDHIDLAGVPLQAVSLAANDIPYFSFAASDPLSNGVGTPAEELVVRMQYEKNNSVVAPWRRLGAVEGRYLLPLATEALHASWLRSTPNDIHALRVEVVDKAGNRVESLFTFKVDFIVAPFAMGASSDTASSQFANTSFDNRADLHGVELAAVEYRLTNTTGKTFYLSVEDRGVHNARNTIEELLRENKVRLKNTPEWRAAFIDNVEITGACPEPGAWVAVNQVLNFNSARSWDAARPPAPSLEAEEIPVSSENPVPPTPSEWRTVTDMDAAFITAETTFTSSKRKLVYQFDYIRDLDTEKQPARVRGWTLYDTSGPLPVVTKSCPDVNFLQQRELESYVAVEGYPRNARSWLEASLPIVVSGFDVFDVSANNAAIAAVSGWHPIPAGHQILVRKRVRLPLLPLHNDTDVANPDTFRSYVLRRYDHSLEWTIQRQAVMKVVHDAGEGNLFSMSARVLNVGEGTAVYKLGR